VATPDVATPDVATLDESAPSYTQRDWLNGNFE
jgi:hypothetical protein